MMEPLVVDRTHRHPISAVPSMCSLLKAVHSVYFEPECRDDFTMGKKIKETTESLLAQAPKDIEASGLSCSHVSYNELVGDPIETIKSIYAQLGFDFSAEYEKVLKDYIDSNRKAREELKTKTASQKFKSQKSKADRLHTYEPAEFGLTEEELCVGACGDYIKAFNVPMSKN